MIPILALVGPMGCGKTTVADVFKQYHPTWVTINFADCVREVVELVYGIPAHQQKLSAMKAQTYDVLGGHTLRHALQQIGTEYFRNLNPNTWTDVWSRRVASAADAGCGGVVVEDLRFMNELDIVRDTEDAHVVYVYRDGPHAKLQRDYAAHTALWRQVLRALGCPVATMHQSELEIYSVSRHADTIMCNNRDMTTTEGRRLMLAELAAMMQRTGLDTPWYLEQGEIETW